MAGMDAAEPAGSTTLLRIHFHEVGFSRGGVGSRRYLAWMREGAAVMGCMGHGLALALLSLNLLGIVADGRAITRSNTILCFDS